MSHLRRALGCIALTTLTCLLAMLTLCAYEVYRLLRDLPAQVDSFLVETRGQALGQIADTEHDLFNRVDQIAAKASSQLTAIRVESLAEIRATRELVATRLDASLARVDAALGEIHGIREDVMPALADLRVTLQHASSVAAQVDDVAPLFLDCRFNPSCAYNLAQGTGKAVEKAAQNVGAMSAEIRASLPAQLDAVTKIEQSTAGIAADVHQVSSAYAKPTTLLGKIWAAIRTGAILYVRTL